MACVRRVEELREDPDFVRYYDYEESHKQDLEASYDTGLERGIEQGLEQGSKQKELEIAKKLLSQNISVEVISEATGLTVEEIRALSNC